MRERKVAVRGLELCLGEWGPADGPVLLLLHGWLDQILAWDRLARALAADGWRVVALEHRGHGRSDHAPAGSTYHFTEYVADLDAVVRAHLPGPLVLLGHSMGGTVAAMFAALRPAQVRGLVLVEGLGPPAVDDRAAVAQLRKHLDQLATPRPLRPLASIAAGAARLQSANPGLPDSEALRLAARVLDASGSEHRWSWDPMHRSRAAVAFDKERFLCLLGDIACPTALLFGARSWYLQLPDLDERRAAIPDVRRDETLACGHSPHLEDPDQLAAVLRDVLPAVVGV